MRRHAGIVVTDRGRWIRRGRSDHRRRRRIADPAPRRRRRPRLAQHLPARRPPPRLGAGAIPQEPRRPPGLRRARRSEEHTSELQSLMRISYAVFCLKKKKKKETANDKNTIITEHKQNHTSNSTYKVCNK